MEAAVLLTRSIRRKLLILLTIVVVMLGGLSYASLTGLAGYKRVVRELDVTIRTAPRSSDLDAAFVRLIEPLSAELPPPNASPALQRDVLRLQRERFLRALSETRRQVDAYFEAVAELPADEGTRRRNVTTRNRLQQLLAEVARNAEQLGETDRRAETVAWIGRQIAALSLAARQAPRPYASLIPNLRAAEEDYRLHVRFVRATSIATLAALLLLVGLLYRWVVQPVRALARGARRVAAGEYHTRISLRSGDEMSELAETFNRMTERFQTVLGQQQNEVQLRSRQLIQSARLADVGFLAAGIAHEVNNPLAVIGMAAESLDLRLSELTEFAERGGADAEELAAVHQYLGMIQTESQRVRDLTQRMLDFARRSPEAEPQDRNLYDLTAVVGEVLEMVGHLKRYAGRTIEWAPSGPIRASVNASQIKQVVLNLVTNALEAMEDGGTLRIGIEQRCESVVLTFADDGCGMSPEVAEHIFDPFFTTKAGGSTGTAPQSLADGTSGHTGTGLGLSICHRIVRDHDGSLDADSDGPGTGSTFTLRLPQLAEPIRHAA